MLIFWKGDYIMTLEEIFSAKTLEEAKSLAVQKFGVAEDLINFEIVEEAKKSRLFGRIKGEFKVKATYSQEIEETSVESVESAVESSESVSPVEEVPVENTPEVEMVSESVEDTANITEDINEVEDRLQEELENVPTPEELLEKAKVAQAYVSRILEKMGVDSSSEIIQTENGIVIDFKGDGTGTIIGKRGETLDALQYLSAMICNKNEKGYYRITLDSCGYRAKRKVILQELARKVSKNVLRNGRSQALEPMNPYERRIIHATISEIDGVSSRSVGEEPFRKVIISSDNPSPKRYGNKKGGYRGNGKSNNNNRRGGRSNNNRNGNGKYHGKKKNYQPRSLDLKTSFEKDYRKPKPEDNLNAGLYGKIEL